MNVTCKICGLETTTKGMATHLKYAHKIQVNEYVSEYEEYRPKYMKPNYIGPTIKCPYCNWETRDISNKSGSFGSHIKKEHNKVISDLEKHFDKVFLVNYFRKYYKQRENQYFLNQKGNYIECLECKSNGLDNRFKKISNSHLKHKHNMTVEDYLEKYDLLRTTSKYTSNLQSKITTEFNLNNYPKKKTSKDEDVFEKYLKDNGIDYQRRFNIDGKEYDFKVDNKVIEVDGNFYHPELLENLTFIQLNNICNDIQKEVILEKNKIHLERLRYINGDFKTYTPNRQLEYHTIVLAKRYLQKYRQEKSELKLLKYLPLVLHFFRNFDFIYPITNETLPDIIAKIPTKIFKPENKVFSNNKSNLGSKYLKANFKSYWHSSFKNKKTPVEAFYDDKILSDILKYRMGINKNNETFDISFHQIIRGLAANRYTVSFFKPVLAASIYKYFLGDNENPTVIDPCAGFGARMLGFKSIYPNGTYIGIEPNKDTYNELKTLSKNFNGIELYNIRQEDYNGTLDCDLTFTSIPYFDTEIYSNHINYGNEDIWNNIFLKPLFRFKNKLINFPNNLRKYFPNGEEYFLRNQTSHFNKNNNQKDEYILKF